MPPGRCHVSAQSRGPETERRHRHDGQGGRHGLVRPDDRLRDQPCGAGCATIAANPMMTRGASWWRGARPRGGAVARRFDLITQKGTAAERLCNCFRGARGARPQTIVGLRALPLHRTSRDESNYAVASSCRILSPANCGMTSSEKIRSVSGEPCTSAKSTASTPPACNWER